MPNTPPPVTLPGYALDAAMARTRAGGITPTSMTETQIITEIQDRATAADTFEFSDFVGTTDVDITCMNNSSCSGDVPDVGSLTFSLSGIEDLSLLDDTGLMDFVSYTQLVMEDAGVTMIQSQAAAGQEDGTRLSFQTYGGWLTNSVFGVQLLDVTEGATTTSRFASFSFGNESGSNPTGGDALQWAGIMVGTNTETGDIIHSDASIQYLIGSAGNANFIDFIIFSNVRNLNDGSEVRFGLANTLRFEDTPITNGSFASASGDIKGSFYGTDHGEVGGIFNNTTHNVIGAFGGTKMQ